MRQSQLFGKTIKEVPREATLASHILLHRAGFIRESVAGRYYFLPLGWRVHEHIKAIIKEEMDKAGAQEVMAPVLHPIELWKETNRTNSVGFELMKVKDRNETEFVLGGTAEEMLVDLVRKFQLSYKDLPFNLYQFSTKFRDELRARGGLLRLREFIMKDAYSFHTSEDDFKKEYEKMKVVYKNIFTRLGIDTLVVESDNGYIGGEYCHEFIMESDAGESKFLMTEDGTYAAHEDVAVFLKEEKNTTESILSLEEVDAPRGNTMEDGVAFHKKPLWQQIKDVLFVDENGRFILALIRGDFDVNEIKLGHLAKTYTLRHATDEEIRSVLKSEPGFISPVGIKQNLAKDVDLLIVGDASLRTIRNAYGGANKKNKDLLNVNIDRDYMPDIEGDIALAKEGYISLANKQALVAKKGIEVGNIFQLGFHYSSRMSGASFTDGAGDAQPYYMGCYGIGLARTLAAIIEKYHDDKGMRWPEMVAPFRIHLIALKGATSEADRIFGELQKNNISVLYDDRTDKSAGEMFADADLIGIPLRVVVSPKTIEKKSVEVKKRSGGDATLVSIEEFIQKPC
jgi:prolyl-tRNA synthetase